jgi:hypothetical protein
LRLLLERYGVVAALAAVVALVVFERDGVSLVRWYY